MFPEDSAAAPVGTAASPFSTGCWRFFPYRGGGDSAVLFHKLPLTDRLPGRRPSPRTLRCGGQCSDAMVPQRTAVSREAPLSARGRGGAACVSSADWPPPDKGSPWATSPSPVPSFQTPPHPKTFQARLCRETRTPRAPPAGQSGRGGGLRLSGPQQLGGAAFTRGPGRCARDPAHAWESRGWCFPLVFPRSL